MLSLLLSQTAPKAAHSSANGTEGRAFVSKRHRRPRMRQQTAPKAAHSSGADLIGRVPGGRVRGWSGSWHRKQRPGPGTIRLTSQCL
eukprot:1115461-Rhodomonas_salina.1